MRRLTSQAAAWIDDRTGFLTATTHFLSEDIPKSAGWPQVFGSVALFLFLIQSLTGILLAFNYAPVPGEAYRSVRYIVREVMGGRIIHGLHHWGASMMIVVVLLHMAQVFIFAAYKKPREATWIAGVFLLLLTFAFGLTGYLLPWDNRAYWGTMVTVQIASGLPVMGPLLTSLIGAGHGVGVVTFSRFYAIHTFVLPAATLLLTVIHVYLVRRHGITPANDQSRETQKFFPKQLFRDFCGIFISFSFLFAAAAFLDAPLERIADPTDATYVPRPEWYFLFLFQLLKLFPGGLEVLATVVLPGAAVLALLMLPFLHSTHARVLTGRIRPAIVVTVIFAAWAGLTISAGWPLPHAQRADNIPSEAKEWARIPTSQIVGFGAFQSLHCGQCHDLVKGPPKPGPTLGSGILRHSKDWLLSHINEKEQVQSTPAGSTLRRQQADALFSFVSNLTPDSVQALTDITPDFINGARVFSANGCGGCHKVNAVGGEMGPALNGLATRHSQAWVRAHFVAPRQLSPGSIMPPYHFSRKDEQGLLLYLFSLPE